jgi:quercetin dioxygenase-like cupin family protein
MIRRFLLGLTIAVVCASTALAQQNPIKRTPLQKVEFPDGYVTITTLIELQPGVSAGRHTHPGLESGYLLEGALDIPMDGQPTLHLKAGDSYSIPAGVVHDPKVVGDQPVKIIGIYVVDKTKPLATPAS